MTEHQRSFFDDELGRDLATKRSPAPIDPSVHPEDKVRLTGQNAVLLERLGAGPVSNVELVEKYKMLKYTARISDLRAAGYVIECERISRGVSMYRLVE